MKNMSDLESQRERRPGASWRRSSRCPAAAHCVMTPEGDRDRDFIFIRSYGSNEQEIYAVMCVAQTRPRSPLSYWWSLDCSSPQDCGP